MADFCTLFRLECRALFSDRAILLTLFVGILFYAALYPLPYANQVARELPVLLVDEDGRMKCKAANQKATQLAPADVTANGKQPIVGAAVLMFQRGDELLGFTKHVADTICSEWL